MEFGVNFPFKSPTSEGTSSSSRLDYSEVLKKASQESGKPTNHPSSVNPHEENPESFEIHGDFVMEDLPQVKIDIKLLSES